MNILILNHAEVEQPLPMSECTSVMEAALAALARGQADQPLRAIFKPPAIKGVMAINRIEINCGAGGVFLLTERHKYKTQRSAHR